MGVFWLYGESSGSSSIDLTVPTTVRSWKLHAVHVNLTGEEGAIVVDLLYDPGSPGPFSGIYQRFIAGEGSATIAAAILATPSLVQGVSIFSLPDIKLPPSIEGAGSQVRLLRPAGPGMGPFLPWNAIFIIEEEEDRGHP